MEKPVFLVGKSSPACPLWTVHVAQASTPDEVYAGNYRLVCGGWASGKGRWYIADSPPSDAKICRRCWSMAGLEE